MSRGHCVASEGKWYSARLCKSVRAASTVAC
jgi:hypothetical protein